MIAVAVLSFLVLSAEGTHEQVCDAASHVGRWWYNGCKQRCVCESVSGEYNWVCYRERKEITCMSATERKLYIDTYKTVSSPGPQYTNYQKLIARHSTMFPTIHTSQWFLPWHRWFQMQMENLLQNVDCRVTLPWWDTAKNAGSPWTVSPWGATTDLLGTSMACVTNGGFASPGWPNNAHGCLSRAFSSTLPTLMQQSSVLGLAATNYVAFTDALETQIHNIVHVRVGGTMVNTWSPEAPEFFLHHGNIDRIWDQWQKKGSANLGAYSSSFNLNSVMPVALGATPAQVNDLKSTRVMYVTGSASSLGMGHLYFSCLFLTLGSLKFELATVDAFISNATRSQVLQIPQRPAPVLNATEEQMLIRMMGRYPSEAFAARLNAGHQAAVEFNNELAKVGMARTSFEDAASRALGFDLPKAVSLLKIPHATDISRQ
jgi:hypothetical protein